MSNWTSDNHPIDSVSSTATTGFIYHNKADGTTYKIPSDSLHYAWVETNHQLVSEAELEGFFKEHGQLVGDGK